MDDSSDRPLGKYSEEQLNAAIKRYLASGDPNLISIVDYKTLGFGDTIRFLREKELELGKKFLDNGLE